ncbi:hypothetical protein V1525DRAFT_408481 [Lipomyces kononenkoae]|uniref:Uncharacterized protein n=1 Tax=Lipomyces kononenkoae TaxID=34357 RepID=A0ACC3SWA6_LIPKO
MTGLQLSDLLAPQLPASQQAGREDADITAVQGTNIQETLERAVGQEQVPVAESIISDTVEAGSAESIKSTSEEVGLVPATSTRPSPKPDVEVRHESAQPSMPSHDVIQLGSVAGISRENTVEGGEDETEGESILPLPRKRLAEESNTIVPGVLPSTTNVIESTTNTTAKSRESSVEPKRKQQKTNHTSTEEEGDSGIRNGTATTAANGLVGESNKPVRGGAPTRRYLNELVTPALLDGVRLVAREQPENPLEVLGKYLLERSKLAKTKSKSSTKQNSSK